MGDYQRLRKHKTSEVCSECLIHKLSDKKQYVFCQNFLGVRYVIQEKSYGVWRAPHLGASSGFLLDPLPRIRRDYYHGNEWAAFREFLLSIDDDMTNCQAKPFSVINVSFIICSQ